MLTRCVCLAVLGALTVGCSAAPEPQRSEPIGSSSAAITTTDALSRADQWVTAKLLYCQSANHQPDYDTSCSSVCTREDNAQWDPYRSDCSGFVSWAWGLPAPGRVTSEFAPFDTSVSKVIQGIDLQPGDAANLTAGGHILLFVQWVTKGSEAEFYEEPGCSSSTPYAHSFTSSVTLNGSSVLLGKQARARSPRSRVASRSRRRSVSRTAQSTRFTRTRKTRRPRRSWSCPRRRRRSRARLQRSRRASSAMCRPPRP